MSQYGIDNYILQFFGDKKGIFLETGSSDPVDQNNTFRLEQNGWSGLLVEPRTEHNHQYKILRPNSIVENYALVSKSFVGETVSAHSHESGHMSNITGIWNTENMINWPATTLDTLLKKHNLTKIDFFTLDVEGYEHEVLDGVDFEYTEFGLIIIETHDYSWNNKNDDFTYLEKFNYRFVGKLSENHQIWINSKLIK